MCTSGAIVAIDGRDVLVFSSAEAAQLALEPIDVRDGRYTMYDASGRRLRAVTEGNDVRICQSTDPTDHSAELAHQLRRFLLSVGEVNEHIEGEELPELLARMRVKYLAD